MTDKQIHTYYGEASQYSDPDAFASDVALSLLDPDNPDQEIDMDMTAQLQTMWHVANDDFRVFLKNLGMNQTQCAQRFCVPLRTVQNWARGENQAPAYTRLMMAELAGMLNVRDRK